MVPVFFKVPIEHLLLTLHLEKSIVLEKVWKKSGISDPKICMNPVSQDKFPAFMAFY